ncbi:hypothetical protein [Phenylobacterium sp.]|uniref:hypothetical protein n=1 Tax=Phenylobacterium sp. TaxID=1871053 RepID=UPI0030F43E98
MPADVSHFSMVGFVFDSRNPAAVSELAERFIQTCQPATLTASDMSCLVRDSSGGELRLGIKKNSSGASELVTVNPAFAGEGQVEVEVSGDASDPDWKPYEIAIAARFSGLETPLVFDLADPIQASQFTVGKRLSINLSAFSYEPQLYADETAYYKAQKDRGESVTYAANYFIPSGMFFQKVGGALPDEGNLPVPYADFAGTVLKTSLKTNTAGTRTFWWALVRTYEGATIDVVIDPTSINQKPKAGSIVSGRFWLSARTKAP